MLVKILGAIDIAAALAFLMLIFQIKIFTPYLIFCAILLGIKGMFIFKGEILSSIDIFSSIILIASIFVTPFSIFLWLCTFLLLAKGFVSFL